MESSDDGLRRREMLPRIVIIAIDPDPSNLLTLGSTATELAVPLLAFRNPLDYWQAKPSLMAGCIVANVDALGDSAEEILANAVTEGGSWKSIAIVNSYQITQAVRLIKRGISDVLELPLKPEVIKPQLARAIDETCHHLQRVLDQSSISTVVNSLSHRDAQVLKLICSGTTSRQIAADMNLSLRTVQGIRSRLAKALGVQGQSGWRRISFQLAATKF